MHSRVKGHLLKVSGKPVGVEKLPISCIKVCQGGFQVIISQRVWHHDGHVDSQVLIQDLEQSWALVVRGGLRHRIANTRSRAELASPVVEVVGHDTTASHGSSAGAT